MIDSNTLDRYNPTREGEVSASERLREHRAAVDAAGKQAMILAMKEDAVRPDGVLLPEVEREISSKVHSGQVPVVRVHEA